MVRFPGEEYAPSFASRGTGYHEGTGFQGIRTASNLPDDITPGSLPDDIVPLPWQREQVRRGMVYTDQQPMPAIVTRALTGEISWHRGRPRFCPAYPK